MGKTKIFKKNFHVHTAVCGGECEKFGLPANGCGHAMYVDIYVNIDGKWLTGCIEQSGNYSSQEVTDRYTEIQHVKAWLGKLGIKIPKKIAEVPEGVELQAENILMWHGTAHAMVPELYE